MAKKSEHFQCPCCGMHAPIERITEEGPFDFLLFEKSLGGKTALTTEEKEKQISYGYRRFYVPGILDYDNIRMTEDAQELIRKRIEEVMAGAPAGEVAKEVTPKRPVPSYEAMLKKWQTAKARNSKLAQNDLDYLEGEGYGVDDAQEVLNEYVEMERSEYDTAEEYSEARSGAWQEFVDAFGNITPPEQ